MTESGVEVEPADAVLSFGVAADVEAARFGDEEGKSVLPYELVCPYGHAFPSRAEYEEWARDVDAVTTTMSAEETLALARALGEIA